MGPFTWSTPWVWWCWNGVNQTVDWILTVKRWHVYESAPWRLRTGAVTRLHVTSFLHATDRLGERTMRGSEMTWIPSTCWKYHEVALLFKFVTWSITWQRLARSVVLRFSSSQILNGVKVLPKNFGGWIGESKAYKHHKIFYLSNMILSFLKISFHVWRSRDKI